MSTTRVSLPAMRWIHLTTVVILVGVLGYALGRITGAGHVSPAAGLTSDLGEPSRAAVSLAKAPGLERPGPPVRANGDTVQARPGAPDPRAERASATSTSPPGSTSNQPLDCGARLDQATAQLAELDRQRKSREGDPIPPRSDGSPRFQERPLLQTFQSAFRATGISGRVDTVDCAEFPCIVFGRVHGDEELVARLEDSKPFSAYDDDIGVMLTWASGDHARGHDPKQTGDRSKPSEISLFAFAFYSPADRARLGDSLDRRIRARATDLWNAVGPDDP